MNSIVTTRLQQMIDDAQAKVPEVMNDIDHEFNARKDLLVPTNRLEIRYHTEEDEMPVGLGMHILGDKDYNFTNFSENQVYTHFGIPKMYGQKLIEWDMAGLLEKNFKEINETKFHNQNVFVRSVHNKVKGWLSPSYKRIDARPVIGTFMEEANKNAMVPVQAYNTDSRMQLRYIFPEIITPGGLEQESFVVGISLSTSDYGGSAFKAEIYMIRLVCLNGMIGQTMFREVHLGSRFGNVGNLTFLSKQTLDLDTGTMISGVKDMTRALPMIKEKVKTTVEEAFVKQPTRSTWEMIKRNTDKKIYEQIEDEYKNNKDVIQLPTMESTWRLANAISFVSQKQDNNDKRIDMENLAMKIIA